MGPSHPAATGFEFCVAEDPAPVMGSASPEGIAGSLPGPDRSTVHECLLRRISRDEVIIEFRFVTLDDRTRGQYVGEHLPGCAMSAVLLHERISAVALDDPVAFLERQITPQ